MPPGDSVQRVNPVSAAEAHAADPASRSAGQGAGAGGAVATVIHPNPTLVLDPALGLVVMQFRDEQGRVTSSIPSQRQIDAYETWQRTRLGQMPPIGGATPPAMPADPATPRAVADQTALASGNAANPISDAAASIATAREAAAATAPSGTDIQTTSTTGT